MEIISPGLTQRKDAQENKIIDLEIKEAILRKFQYENRKHRDNMGIVQKKPKENERNEGMKNIMPFFSNFLFFQKRLFF